MVPNRTFSPSTPATIEELCEQASVLEALGRYEEAEGLFGELWPSIFSEPQVESLQPRQQALVLIRAATITSCIGSTRKLPDAQRRARDFADRSRALFSRINDDRGMAEAMCELARIERRLGNLPVSRTLLLDSLKLAEGGADEYLTGLIQLRRAIVENVEQNFSGALAILQDAAPLYSVPFSDTESLDLKKIGLVGNYFNTRGLVYRNLALQERSWEFFDAGYRDLTAAQYFFEQAGHKRWEAAALNNLSLFALVHKEFERAHDYINRARRCLVYPADLVLIAQVEETRARIFAAEGRFDDAERVVEQTVDILKETSEEALLKEVLVIRDTIFQAREHPEAANEILNIERPRLRLIKGDDPTPKPTVEIVTFRVGEDDDSLAHLGFPPDSIIPFEVTMRAREGQFILAKIVPGDMMCAGFYHVNADGRSVMIDTYHPDYEPEPLPSWRVQVRGVHSTLQIITEG